MKNLKFSAIAILGAGLITMMLFQNCVPHVSTGSGDSTSLSSLSGGSFYEWSASQAQASLAAYESVCANGQAAAASYVAVAAGANMNAFGDVVGKITQIDEIIGAANLILYADPAGAVIDSISAFNGKVQLCGLVQVGAISNVKGNFVVEGTVGPVDGFEGNLIIIGGDFPLSVTNTKGIILVKDANGQYFGRTY